MSDLGDTLSGSRYDISISPIFYRCQVDRKDFIGRDALAANPTPVPASAGSPPSKAKR